MSSLSRELVFLILQFLDEEKFKETVHKCVLSPLCLCVGYLGLVGWLLYAFGFGI
ncbi:hypothetical protein BDA96_03G120400 [Sorghum bicolor]|uniref:TPL/SMU1 LisH-like dimerisation domain-containing protein n=1 Tax=Sorghum bicolor TaxID=4558 RepID=A0A921UM15_SORBI|nr:hypothetical protein BDA96_03G120400 [Sorghum bicolor]